MSQITGPFYTETPDACGSCGQPCEETWYLPELKIYTCADCTAQALQHRQERAA